MALNGATTGEVMQAIHGGLKEKLMFIPPTYCIHKVRAKFGSPFVISITLVHRADSGISAYQSKFIEDGASQGENAADLQIRFPHHHSHRLGTRK